MAPIATKKRSQLAEEIHPDMVSFWETGFCFFGPVPKLQKTLDLWRHHRAEFMRRWMTFQPFYYGKWQVIDNYPGTRPHCWWVENGHKRRVIAGQPANGPGIPEQQFRCGCPRYWQNMISECESQAEYLERNGYLTDYEKEILQTQSAG